MNMKKLMKIGLCTLMIFICSFIVSTSVYAVQTISWADGVEFRNVLNKTDPGTGEDENCSKITLPGGGQVEIFKLSVAQKGKFYNFSINGEELDKFDNSVKKRMFTNLEQNIEKSNITQQGQQLIYNEIRYSYDIGGDFVEREIVDRIQPDMFTSYEWTRPFSDTLSTIIGCICCTIILSIVWTVLLDIMYLQFPIFREKTFQATRRRGGGLFSFIQNRTQLERPWFISYEAAYAYKTSVESNGDANALLVYFKHRTVSFLVVSVCLAYLMCGLFMDTVTWIWDHFSDIFEPAKWGMVN